MLLHEIVETSRRVGETRGRLEKIGLIADRLRRAGPGEIEAAAAFLAGELRQGRVGVGYAGLRAAMPEGAAASPALTVAEVDAALDRYAAVKGAGSAAGRRELLTELFSRATADEQDFLLRLLVGELRQGALEGVMVEAVARAAELPAAEVRRALMVAGALAPVARAALAEGRAGLARFALRLFQPVRPMLAQTADDPADALGRFGEAAFEHKLDGARVQAHKSGAEVRLYSRELNDVTGSAPELAEALARLPCAALILDGEAIVLRPDGRPEPFQTTMRRFGRKLDVAAMRDALPLTGFFFDCLHLDGDDMLERSYGDRMRALDRALPPELRMPRLVTADEAAAEAFASEALARGHEGVMAKAPGAPYEAGARGAGWLKIKRAHTLDLVVLAAEWGHGRRKGWLSNLHLGARDPETGGFVMLGKTFKGMTDAMLRGQTERLLGLEIARDAHTVHVRPALVVEIAFNDIQASPRYPGGLALRFARVKRYRDDKRPEEADAIDTVRALHKP
jgi:DNA ligase-1